MKRFEFAKMEGAGNDFILVDNRKKLISTGAAAAKKLCDRKLGIGADGLILAERSKKADVRMRIFNPDGSEAEMCGNGVRCLARFAADRRIAPKQMTIETLAGFIRARVDGKTVVATLTEPRGMELGIRLSVNGSFKEVHFIDTGVPHTVVPVSSLEDCEVSELGRQIRYHRRFAPRGTNVNFLARGKDGLSVRTYERGVEDETLACGTGSTAAALVAAALHGLKSPVSVRTRGGEKLKVYFEKDGDRFREVRLEGPVRQTFEGRTAA